MEHAVAQQAECATPPGEPQPHHSETGPRPGGEGTPRVAREQDAPEASGPAATPAQPSVCFVATSPAIVDLLLGINTGHVGGAEVQQVLLARELAARGWRVAFVIADDSCASAPVEVEGFEVLVAYRRSGLVPGLRFCCHKLPGLWQAMRRVDCDVYIARGRSWLIGAATLQARLRGRKSVFWAASAADVRRKRWPVWQGLAPHALFERYGVAVADLMIAQSEEQREVAREQLGRESVVVRNLLAVQDTARWTGGGGVLWVGEMRPIKQPWLCLEVARQLPHITFRMVGGQDESDPSLFGRIATEARALPNVEVVGHVPFAEVGAHFDQADVLLCTSESEGSPNTFLQAWSRGTPVVSTVDPDGVISRFDLGCCTREASGLAEGIQSLLSDATRRMALGERARTYVRTHHHPGVIVPIIEGLLARLSPRVSAGLDGGPVGSTPG